MVSFGPPDGSVSPDRPAIPVLFVGGSASSGSTLLGALLGRLPGFFNAGEMNLLWEKWLRPSQHCGCGAPLSACPFWSAVVADVEAAGVDPARMAEFADRLDHTRRLPTVLARRLTPDSAAAWTELAAGTARLYEAAFRHSGASYLVDLSKVPTHLLLLQSVPAADVRVLHLVRDGRAVAFSWERRRRLARAGVPQGAGMRRHGSVLDDLLIWHFQNFAIDRLRRRFRHATRVRYESIAASPAVALPRALARLGLEVREAGPLEDGLVARGQHAVGGKDRVRFAGAGTAVAVDDAWRRELGSLRLALWSLMAAPGLLRFGYPIRASRSSDSERL
jgi:hypothetical protein